MGHIAYVDGRYLPLAKACVNVEDRGFQFADGVYEVFGIHRGKLVDTGLHFERLERSLRELRIAWPMPVTALRLVMREVIRRNRITNSGVVYLQITRGAAPRAHAFPAVSRSTMTMTARAIPAFDPVRWRQGVAVITIPDIRWGRCDIKSVSLLANVLGKQQAMEAGAFEAWMVDREGFVTEGTASNAWIVSGAGEVITRHADQGILDGITRRSLRRLAGERGMPIVERPFSVSEAKAAAEAFLTGSTAYIKPVVRIDETQVGVGEMGPITEQLLNYYVSYMEEAEDPADAPPDIASRPCTTGR